MIDTLTDNIKRGKIVSFPTETVYALSCDANNSEAINKIYETKHRNISKLLSVFIDIDFLNNFADYDSKFANIVKDELERGTTIIFRKKSDKILPNIKSNTIGIRYPKHDFVRSLLKRLNGLAIVATSTNISGFPPLCNYSDILNNFKNIDYVVDNDLLNNSVLSGNSSKIISVVDDKIEIIRE